MRAAPLELHRATGVAGKALALSLHCMRLDLFQAIDLGNSIICWGPYVRMPPPFVAHRG